MNRSFLAVFVSLLISLFTLPGRADGQLAEVPTLRSRVTDLTGVLGSRVGPLREQLRLLEEEKGSQVAVLVVNTTQPETIEQFSIRVVDQWKLGRRGIDDGVLLLVALKDRKVRIEVGRGLEGDIPDVIAHRIIQEQILPQFRKGEVPTGIEAGVHALVGLIRGVPLPLPQEGQGGGKFGGVVTGLFVAILLGKLCRWFFGELVAFPVAWALSFASMIFSLPFGVAFVLSCFVGMLAAVDGGPTMARGGRYRYGSGGFTGGSWGGGGFSGGGGSFSGGGASGGW